MLMKRAVPVFLLLWMSVLGQSAVAEERKAEASPAQDAAAVQREAMKRLDPWVGVWKGSGWILTGRDQPRQEFTITETVQSKLGGRALLVEGLGRGKDPKTGVEADMHHTLAVLSYDEIAKIYRFRTHEAMGRALDVEAKPMDGGLEWGFRDETRGATIRFTIRLDGNRWHEVGEASMDGKTWHKFMDMTLERQGTAAPAPAGR
jgi:hypothetical protein